jgi:hypothetical protein
MRVMRPRSGGAEEDGGWDPDPDPVPAGRTDGDAGSGGDGDGERDGNGDADADGGADGDVVPLSPPPSPPSLRGADGDQEEALLSPAPLMTDSHSPPPPPQLSPLKMAELDEEDRDDYEAGEC